MNISKHEKMTLWSKNIFMVYYILKVNYKKLKNLENNLFIFNKACPKGHFFSSVITKNLLGTCYSEIVLKIPFQWYTRCLMTILARWDNYCKLCLILLCYPYPDL